jgi:hypothetical protein
MAKLALVGRYSQYCNVGCAPFVVKDDLGIGSEGRQTHWVVILVKDESASPASVYYVEGGRVKPKDNVTQAATPFGEGGMEKLNVKEQSGWLKPPLVTLTSMMLRQGSLSNRAELLG